MRVFKLCVAALAACLTTTALGQEAFESSGPYTRTVVEGDVVRLDIATRVFAPVDGDGPTVTLVGAIHVGEPGYYELLQRLMDAQDLVLFEGVGEPGSGDVEPGSDEAKAIQTHRRLMGLAAIMLAYQEANGAWPGSVAALLGAESGLSDSQRRRVVVASVDGWGRAVTIEAGDGGEVALVSLGSDGEEGGEGAAADQRLSSAEAVSELGNAIHVRLARMLGLSFQGLHILTDQPHWRNSDMAWDQVEAELKERGSFSGEMLGDLLDGGNPLFAQLLQGLEAFATASPMINTMVKLMLVTQLSQASDGPVLGDAAMDEVIIKLRNQVVVDDLKEIVGGQDAPGSIAVFYGAGHMADMEERLFEQLGYRVVGGLWMSAIRLDLSQQGLSDREMQMVRQQVKKLTAERE